MTSMKLQSKTNDCLVRIAEISLDSYIRTITTQEDLVASLNSRIDSLRAKAASQEHALKPLRQECAQLEMARRNPSSVGAGEEGAGIGATSCPSCGRLYQEAELRNQQLLSEEQKLLAEINAAKAELATKLQEIQGTPAVATPAVSGPAEESKGVAEPNNPIAQLFNATKLASLQGLLDHAETTDDMLLFVDKKQVTWQIMKRNDISIARPEELDNPDHNDHDHDHDHDNDNDNDNGDNIDHPEFEADQQAQAHGTLSAQEPREAIPFGELKQQTPEDKQDRVCIIDSLEPKD
jgi:hypothetical protein